MKNIKINNVTIFLLFILFITGYIKIGIIISLIIIIHELGHIFFIKLFKFKIISITFYPFGGLIKTNKDINTKVNIELLISIGGILFQIILFLVIFLIPLSINSKLIFYKYNKSIIFFNILPIIPLDGSIILLCLLNKILPYKKSYYIYLIISIISTILYIIINYYYSLNNYLIITLFIYKTYYYYKNFKYTYNRFLLERYLNNYKYNKISTKKGNINILMLDTYQFFKENNNIISEKKKLDRFFSIDKT